jgi:hypothetical protein
MAMLTDARPLAQHASQRAEHQRGGQEQRALEQADERDLLVGDGPHQEGDREADAEADGPPHRDRPALLDQPGDRRRDPETDQGQHEGGRPGRQGQGRDLDDLAGRRQAERGPGAARRADAEGDQGQQPEHPQHHRLAPRAPGGHDVGSRRRLRGRCLGGDRAHPFHPFES